MRGKTNGWVPPVVFQCARSARPLISAAAAVVLIAGAPAAFGQQQGAPSRASAKGSAGRLVELPVPPGPGGIIYATKGGFSRGPVGGFDECPVQTSTHTDFNFSSGGNANAQGGFAENEIAAVSFTVPASAFPIRLETAEILFAQTASIQTTTQWTVMVWEGTPTSGSLIFSESSDGSILPHIVITPPANNALLVFQIDPNDPQQILIENNGSDTFTIGFRVDDHNNQQGNPCFTAPSAELNAFPTTDFSGLAQPAQNLLFGLNCGSFGCPPNGGWTTFGALNSLCRPTGDWIMRATWEPTNCGAAEGACCLPNETCQTLTQAACLSAGGVYQGNGIACGSTPCPQASGACCFPNNNCLTLTPANCAAAGGTYQGNGVACNGSSCPVGACCLASGECIGGVSAGQCTAQGGVFHGAGSTCGGIKCPQPTGACCLTNGGCLTLTRAQCDLIPGVWAGGGTTCAGTNCQNLICYPNCDQSTTPPILNVADFTCFLQRFAGGESYANCDGSTVPPILNVADFTCYLQSFATGCP